MKRKLARAVLLVALLLGVVAAQGQDAPGPKPKRPRTPDDYKPRTLKEVAAEGPGAESRGDKAETMTVQGDILPSRVRVRYDGATRPFPQQRREVLRQWARLYAGFPEGYTEPYETELLFVEDGAEHWLAVRKSDRPRFARELKRGEEVDLYLIRVGAAKTPGGWEPVLLIESFRKPNG